MQLLLGFCMLCICTINPGIFTMLCMCFTHLCFACLCVYEMVVCSLEKYHSQICIIIIVVPIIYNSVKNVCYISDLFYLFDMNTTLVFCLMESTLAAYVNENSNCIIGK